LLNILSQCRCNWMLLQSFSGSVANEVGNTAISWIAVKDRAVKEGNQALLDVIGGNPAITTERFPDLALVIQVLLDRPASMPSLFAHW